MEINIYYKTNKIINDGDIVDLSNISYIVIIKADSVEVIKCEFSNYDDAMIFISEKMKILKPKFDSENVSILHKKFTVRNNDYIRNKWYS